MTEMSGAPFQIGEPVRARYPDSNYKLVSGDLCIVEGVTPSSTCGSGWSVKVFGLDSRDANWFEKEQHFKPDPIVDPIE